MKISACKAVATVALSFNTKIAYNDNNSQLSVLVQRFNAVLLHDCFVDEVAGHSS